MLSLPVVAIADLASPAELFRCAHFHNAILSAGACLSRQGLRTKAKANAKDQSDKIPHHVEYCASGECEQGDQIKEKLANYVVPVSRKERDKEQRRALGAENVRKIEQQIAAKVASGEFRMPEPLPAAIADPAIERAASRAFDASAPAKKLLPEAESKGEGTVADKVCKEVGCTKPLRVDNESGYCKEHGGKYVQRERRAAKKPGRRTTHRNADPAQPRPAKPIPPAVPVVYDGLAQLRPPDSIEALLEQRRAYHSGEVERCERALAALRGAA